MTATLTVAQVADALGVTPETVRQMTRRGELPGFKTGRAGKTSPYRYRASQIEAHIRAREMATQTGRAS